jgi:putative phosphoesterase
MYKIAVSSDNHFDVNKQDPETVLQQQVTFLTAAKIDMYLIAGDLFNDFQKTTAFVGALQVAMPNVVVRFIAGNHDMGRGISFAELENNDNPLYLHNQYVDISGTDWRVIGNNGWYDYEFARHVSPEEVATFKRGLYYDRVIEQPMSDPARMDLVLVQTQAQLEAAKAAGKQVVFMTHFAPIADELVYPPADARWNVVNGVLGSPRLGTLLESYPNVEYVYYGHIHVTVPPREKNGVIYENPSVGYNRRRLMEWTADTFIEAWQNKVRFLVLTTE